MSYSLQPHGLQHARPPCSSPAPGIYSNSCPLSQWCHPTISPSVILFSSCLQSFPASGSFPVSHLFPSGGQSIGVSASTSVLPVNTQDWFPLGWTGWISLQSKGLSRVFSNTTVQKHHFFGAQLFLWKQIYFHKKKKKKRSLWIKLCASDGCELSCQMITDLGPLYIPFSPQMWQRKPLLPSWPSFFLLNLQLRVNSCLRQLLATLGKCQSPQSSPGTSTSCYTPWIHSCANLSDLHTSLSENPTLLTPQLSIPFRVIIVN